MNSAFMPRNAPFINLYVDGATELIPSLARENTNEQQHEGNAPDCAIDGGRQSRALDRLEHESGQPTDAAQYPSENTDDRGGGGFGLASKANWSDEQRPRMAFEMAGSSKWWQDRRDTIIRCD